MDEFYQHFKALNFSHSHHWDLNLQLALPEFVSVLPQVCLTGCSRDLMVRVDQLCSQRNIKVFCGDVYGYYGYMFSDLGKEHHYVE